MNANTKKVGFYGGKFIPFHNGHFYSIIQASNMVDELYVIIGHVEDRDRRLCEGSKIPYIPLEVRLQWMIAATKDMPHVKILAVEDLDTDNLDYNWDEGARRFKEAIGKEINVVFSSEHSYTPFFKRNYPNAEHVVLDADRAFMPISATKLRTEGVYKHWNMIPNVARPFFVKKVAIIGTESCGKSTLTQHLTNVFQTVKVDEYGRMLCERLGTSNFLTEENYNEIVYGHKYWETQMVKEANKILFIDSEAVVTQYYAKFDLGRELDLVESAIKTQDYDLYLFLEPDVAWVQDGFRQFGAENIREKNNELLKKMFDERNIPYVTIKGNYQERFKTALNLVEELIS